MTISCDLRLELQGHHFELRCREFNGAQLEVDFVVPGLLAMLALIQAVGISRPGVPSWLRVHVWLQGRQITTLEPSQ